MSKNDEQIEVAPLESLETAPKRKRPRVVKKDAVYTVSGLEGESLDTKASRKSAKKKVEEAVNKTLFDEDFHSPVEAPTDPALLFPPHPGRKSKAELEAIAAWEAHLRKDVVDEPKQEAVESKQDLVEPKQDEAGLSQDKVALNQEESEPKQENTEQNQENTEPKQDISAHSEAPIQEPDFIIIEDIPSDEYCIMMAEKEMAEREMAEKDAVDMPLTHKESKPMQPVAAKEEQKRVEETAKVDFNFDNLISAKGVLEAMPDGYGFLRSSEYDYVSSPDDVYISVQFVKQYSLKTGDVLECKVRPPYDGEKFFTLTSVEYINGRKPEEVRDRTPFEHLTPLFPNEKFNLCGDPKTTNKSTRIVDLFSPIGKGQRALIVAQPKTGKTILLKDIANAIAANHPEAYLMMLLIDERPEEVTDMARTVNAEVIASTFDEPAERHVKIAGLVLEKAKRMVECGHDVVIFLDSITRLARAYNTVAPASGKILTGGVDANALQKPKRFFGAARNIEGGGSLTIVATALIDTGSKMDEVIFEEFKGTGNMELQLERSLSNKRIFPAVNLVASSTRRDDLLFDQYTQDKMWIIRNFIADMNPIEAMTDIQKMLERTRDHAEFFMAMNS